VYGAVDGRNYVFNANVINLNLTSREDYPLFLDRFKNKSSE
jgi:hypothetical protein